MDERRLKREIREIPDFPKPGILFYDLSTLFLNGDALRAAVDGMVAHYERNPVDAIAAVEARGFLLGSAIAYRLGVGLVIVRKLGKLPGATIGETYSLEYGEGHIEIHEGAVRPGQRIAVIDDLLATGGTSAASRRLLERAGGTVTSFGFLVELAFLGGRQRLEGTDIFSLLTYA